MSFDLKHSVRKNQFVVNYGRMWPFIKPIWPIALLSLLICVPVGSLDAAIALFLKRALLLPIYVLSPHEH